MKLLLAAALAGASFLPFAAAEPGGAAEVYSPNVTRGETEFEVRAGALEGGDWQIKAEVSRGIADWWRPGLVAAWERGDGDTRFAAVAIENVFDFTATRQWPVHLGGYLEYEWTQEGGDELQLKLLMEHVRGPLDMRLNLIGERLLGSNAPDEWEFGYAAAAGYALGDDLVLGVEGFGDVGTSDRFGDLGDHAHYWGPFAQFEIGHVGDGDLELQLGYLAGFAEAQADGQYRLKLEYEFGD